MSVVYPVACCTSQGREFSVKILNLLRGRGVVSELLSVGE